jgi:proteasome assembly chaperone (PAC2) family protein
VGPLQYVYRPEVSGPLVVAAFEGWNDGGEGATLAARHLREQWNARRFATLDPEDFYDFQVNRPTVRQLDGVTRRLDWPANEFFHARPGGRDVLLVIGVEPNTRWRTFAEAVLQVASDLGAETLVTLGAFLADVPHTVPAPVNASSQDPAWLAKPGVDAARYEGPTGIVGVLHDQAAKVGMSSVSLWAASPHYLPTTTNPKVALALMEQLRDLLDLEVETADMAGASAAWQRNVDEAIEEDGNLGEYVRRLEEETQDRDHFGDIPSGDALAEELERYLREQPDGG